MELMAYLGDEDDVQSQITIRKHENETVIDCRDLNESYDLVVDGDTEESRSLANVAPIEEIPLEKVTAYRYSDASSEADVPFGKRQRLDEAGYSSTYPIVWKRGDDTYIIISGRPVVQLLVEFGFDRIPVHVLEDDLEALRCWARRHFPHPAEESDFSHGTYDVEQQEEAINRLLDRWERSEIETIERLQYALERFE